MKRILVAGAVLGATTALGVGFMPAGASTHPAGTCVVKNYPAKVIHTKAHVVKAHTTRGYKRVYSDESVTAVAPHTIRSYTVKARIYTRQARTVTTCYK